MDAVVKVYCVHTEPNYSLPWQRKRQENSTSTAFMVAGPKKERWLLTNAHSVDYHTQVGGRALILLHAGVCARSVAAHRLCSRMLRCLVRGEC